MRLQHEAGRKITAKIVTANHEASIRDDLAGYARMMRAHAAREDTVLFPALHRITAPKELRRLGRVLADRERALFGDDSHARVNARIAGIEERFGLNDLGRATVHPR